MQHAILQQEQSGVQRPANTFVGKMDQVHQWMNNPSSDPTGLGGCPVHVYGPSSMCIIMHCSSGPLGTTIPWKNVSRILGDAMKSAFKFLS